MNEERASRAKLALQGVIVSTIGIAGLGLAIAVIRFGMLFF